MDVEKVEEIQNQDKLTVIPKPGCSPQVHGHELLTVQGGCSEEGYEKGSELSLTSRTFQPYFTWGLQR